MDTKHTWKKEEVLAIYDQPLIDLMHQATELHQANHNPRHVQVSTLINIKEGGCPEDCGYCPQAARYHTDVDEKPMMSLDQVEAQAKRAKKRGSSRVCMGASWRNVRDNNDFEKVLEMVRTINKMDMEVCCTLGMITETQAKKLSEAGLYAYNHNLDTSESYYKEVISTRGYGDRLKTIKNVRKTNLTVCSGGIIGMGESIEDRVDMLITLSSLDPHPESVPINCLVPVEGTPLEKQQPVSSWDLIRMVATTRLVLPNTTIRLSAGRSRLSDEAHALCYLVGAGSIFAGDKLLTTPNPDINRDLNLFKILGLQPSKPFEKKKQPLTVEAEQSEFRKLQKEKPLWSRPNHTIERNIIAQKTTRKKT